MLYLFPFLPGVVWLLQGATAPLCCLETSSRPSAGPGCWTMPLHPVLVDHHYYGQESTKWCSLWPVCLLKHVISAQQEQHITQVYRVHCYWVTVNREGMLNWMQELSLSAPEGGVQDWRGEAPSCARNRDCKPRSCLSTLNSSLGL